MKIKNIPKNTLKNIIGLLFLFIVYWSLFFYFASQDIVAKLFAPGKHLSLLIILSASFFIIFRLFIIVILPGLFLAIIGLKVCDRCIELNPRQK